VVTKSRTVSKVEGKSKFKKYKFPYEENAQKIQAELVRKKIKAVKRIPIALKQKKPKKRKKGYFSYSREAKISQQPKTLSGLFHEVWAKQRSSKMLLTEKKSRKEKTISLGKEMPSHEKPFSSTKDIRISGYTVNSAKTQSIQVKLVQGIKSILRGIKGLYQSGKGRLLRAESIRGRIIKLKPYQNSSDKIAIIPSIKKVALAKKSKKKISKELLVAGIQIGRPSLTYIFVLDLSESMVRHIKIISEAIKAVHSEAFQHRDKIGVIAVQGKMARVVLDPITNLFVVSRAIENLRMGGSTPLASGLVLAKQMIDRELRKNPKVIPIVIIVTDGLANVPLSSLEKPIREIDVGYPAQSDTLDAAKQLSSARALVVVINPFEEKEYIVNNFISPTLLTKQIASLTKGLYFGYKTGFISSNFTVDSFIQILDEINILVHKYRKP